MLKDPLKDDSTTQNNFKVWVGIFGFVFLLFENIFKIVLIFLFAKMIAFWYLDGKEWI